MLCEALYKWINTIQYNMLIHPWIQSVGRDGALAESITFNRRVVDSTPALAGTQGPWASPLPVRFGVKLQYSVRAVVGSASE